MRAPEQPELAIGAVSENGQVYLSRLGRQFEGELDDYLDEERRYQMAESSNAVVSSIAIYERECRVRVWRYEFVGTLSPHEFGSHIVDGEFSFADLSLSRQRARRRSLRF